MQSPGRGQTMRIGAVIRALTPDFPDVTVSKIRFLEAEGLVTPERTPSGYRLFSAADVERLRYILAAQRDRFWPLRVIRESLDAIDRGLSEDFAEAGSGRPGVPTTPADPALPTAASLTAPARLRLTEAELREASGLEPQVLAALTSFGLLHADESGHFDDHQLAVARAAGALAAYGVEARHLRAFRSAADREIGLVRQIVTPARSAGGKHAPADPTAEVLAHCIALHAALVAADLTR